VGGEATAIASAASDCHYKQRVEDLTDRLAKIERKLGAMMF